MFRSQTLQTDKKNNEAALFFLSYLVKIFMTRNI